MYVHTGVSVYNFQKNIVFFSLKIFFAFTNSVESDELQRYAAFAVACYMLADMHASR